MAGDDTTAPSPLGYQSLSLKCTMLRAQPLVLCFGFPVIPPLDPPEGSRMVCEFLCPPTAGGHSQPCTHTASSCCWDSPALSHPNPLERLLFPAPLCKQTNIPRGWESPGTDPPVFSRLVLSTSACHSPDGWENSFPHPKVISRTCE